MCLPLCKSEWMQENRSEPNTQQSPTRILEQEQQTKQMSNNFVKKKNMWHKINRKVELKVLLHTEIFIPLQQAVKSKIHYEARVKAVQVMGTVHWLLLNVNIITKWSIPIEPITVHPNGKKSNSLFRMHLDLTTHLTSYQHLYQPLPVTSSIKILTWFRKKKKRWCCQS